MKIKYLFNNFLSDKLCHHPENSFIHGLNNIVAGQSARTNRYIYANGKS